MGRTGARNSAPRGADRKRRRLKEDEEREVTTRAFSACVRPLEMVTSFKYLVQVTSSADDYWPAVVKNLSRASKLLSSMSRIFSREGAAPRVYGFFFKAVVQAVLLFGAETWVVTPRMGKSLGGVQTQVDRRLTGRLLQRTLDRSWRYTLAAAAAREEAVFLTMEEYIRRQQNRVSQYIATRSLLDQCEG